jgi:RHS repeat-associated protein
VVVTSSTGAVLDRLSYDPWGKRRNATGNAAPSGAWSMYAVTGTGPLTARVPLANWRVKRGFTGHEHLDEWGLINMNGRVYHPDLGRFLSADPDVQFPQSTQGLDRYSYVQNHPLSATDPSGHGILSILGSILSFLPGPNIVGGLLIAVDGFLEGGLRGMVMSALSMAASWGVGVKFGDLGSIGREALRAVTHGLAQGAISAAFGGKFGAGFLAAGFSSAAGSFSPRFGGGGDLGKVLRVVRAAAIGGTASVLGGGKFGNGATTAAFVQAFGEGVRAGREAQASGLVRIYKEGGLDAQAARKLFDETLSALRAEGKIPERSLWQRLLGTDRITFSENYGVLYDTDRVAGYQSIDDAIAQEGMMGGRAVGGVTLGENESIIYRQAAHYSEIPALGNGPFSPPQTMRWVILHEYAHHLNPRGTEADADAFAKSRF